MYNSDNNNNNNNNGSAYMYASGYCSNYQNYPNQNLYNYTTADYQNPYSVGYNRMEHAAVPVNSSMIYSSVQNKREFDNNGLPSNGHGDKSNVGMALLQKMGWNPGEGLGKFKDGQVEPLKVRGKHGKMGLMSYEEYKKEQETMKSSGLLKRDKNFPKMALKDKHPVTALMEYSAKQHLVPPTFKTYLDMPAPINQYSMSVIFMDAEYKPPGIFKTKRDAKKAAAILCLRQLNVL